MHFRLIQFLHKAGKFAALHMPFMTHFPLEGSFIPFLCQAISSPKTKKIHFDLEIPETVALQTILITIKCKSMNKKRQTFE